MLLSHYVPKILTALFGGLFIAAGILTFGEPLLFDQIFIAVLVFTGIVCRHDINVIGVVVILIIQRVFEEVAWVVSESEYTMSIKALFYLIGIVTWYFLRYDKLSRLFLICLLLCLGAEFYWSVTDKNSPDMHWYIIVFVGYMLTRHMIFIRVPYTEHYLKKRASSINLDWHIFKLNAVAALVQSLNIVEYLIRGVAGYKNVTMIYQLYPYLMQAIATYAVWIIFHESYRLLLPRLLRA